jgi:hypothetical protein
MQKQLYCFTVRLLCRRRVLEANRRLEEARRAGGSDVEIAADAIAGGGGNGDRCVLQLTTLPTVTSGLASPLHGLCAPSQPRMEIVSAAHHQLALVDPVALLCLSYHFGLMQGRQPVRHLPRAASWSGVCGVRPHVHMLGVRAADGPLPAVPLAHACHQSVQTIACCIV